jgi:pimeloyl-ACP methyl ester carboxylesterase
MNKLGFTLLQFYMRTLSFVAPQKAAKKALDMFFTPKKHPSKTWEIDGLKTAKNITLEGGINCLVWGEGKPILLMHGWEGRASQMAVFLPYLSSSEYQLIALNAPAHGLSEGMRSNPHKFIKAIFTAQQHFGDFHAIVGHSMGGGSAVYAALENLNVNKVISIAGPNNFENLVRAFALFVGLRGKALNLFMQQTEEEVDLPFSTLNLASRVTNLNKPLLVIHDEDDVEVPFVGASRYKDTIAQGEFYATKGLGHRKIMQSPEVLQKVADFIG